MAAKCRIRQRDRFTDIPAAGVDARRSIDLAAAYALPADGDLELISLQPNHARAKRIRQAADLFGGLFPRSTETVVTSHRFNDHL